MKKVILSASFIVTVVVAITAFLTPNQRANADTGKVTQGMLEILRPEGAGACPLKHTDVKVEISGFLARVNVTQEFHNPLNEKIEAVYVFPMSQNAAVDSMTMLVGERKILGKIKRREEAREIYEQARAAGKTASLLDQERPNIFTQSVANILPGETIKIEISYVETLKYEDGRYEFSFPMVVGPRYIPGKQAGRPDTDAVPDAARVSPQITPKGTRAGHDISLEVTLDAGVPIDNLNAALHKVAVQRVNTNRAVIKLERQNEIPNRDFILTYDVSGAKIEDALLAHRTAQNGLFTFILQPPERVTPAEVTPKEIVFVVDTSGSMMGFPLEKGKELINMALANLYEKDTFNLITFSGDTHILFEKPVPATPENVKRAQQFLNSNRGGGGTEMMKAIRASLDPSDSQQHLRIVVFVTDGYVGNDFQIISEVQKHRNARVFSFGIGNSVNRFLLDKMAEQGRGEVSYITLSDDGSSAAKRLHERIRNPILTDISIDWNGLPVEEVYPKDIPDLFSAQPVVVVGRYTKAAKGSIKLKGKMAGQDYEREIKVVFPEKEAAHDALGSIWARRKIDYLMNQDMAGLQSGNTRDDLREAIIDIGLEYKLMTQFTSFVAVEETVIKEGGQPRRVEVPVEMPDGVSYEGIFGEDKKDVAGMGAGRAKKVYTPRSVPSKPSSIAPLPESRPMVAGNGDEAISERDDRVSKLESSLERLVRMHKAGKTEFGKGYEFVKNARAEVRVRVKDKSEKTLEALKKLGFREIGTVSGKYYIGTIEVSRLEELAKLPEVAYVAPLR